MIKPQIQNQILGGKVNFPLCLAPMVGLTHVAFRRMARRYLPQNAITIWPTEMLNSRRIPSENLEKTPETMRSSEESELIPQILGNEEVPIQKSISILKNWGAEGIDINMGCPVQKALKHNYGVSLMGDPKYAAEVVRMAYKNSEGLPISVKLRAVEEGRPELLLDFVNGLIDEGASWLCLHPRTAAQKRRGSADWDQIAWLKHKISIPLIGNGDIQTVEDVHQMLKETNCDMVMSGRAFAARPWMIWQLGEDLGFLPPKGRSIEKAPRTSLEEGEEYGKMLLEFINECEVFFPAELALRKIRFFIKVTSVWLSFGQSLISASTKAKNLEELKINVKNFFSVPQEMLQRTNLRS